MLCNCFRRSSTLTKEQKDERKISKFIEKQIVIWMKEYRKSIKILLLGAAESGKTTIIKQMKILHIKGFTDEERANKAKEIRINLLESIQEIVESLHTDQEFRFASSTNEENWTIVRNIRIPDIENNLAFQFDEFFFGPIRSLWHDQQVQLKFPYLNGFSILDSAQYFLDKIDEIQRLNYVPSDADILRSRRRTTEIQKIEFEVKIPSKYGGGEQIFWMFDVGGQKGERRKWIQVFDGISAILFLVSASEFDVMTREVSKLFTYEKVHSQAGIKYSQSVAVDKRRDYRENRMLDSLRLFQDICESRFLEYCGLICFLNKQDQLRDKIVNRQCRLSDYFEDYATFEYEPKVSWLAEVGQGQFDGGRRYLNVRGYWKGKNKNGSREGSINSSVALEQIASQLEENKLSTDTSTINLESRQSSAQTSTWRNSISGFSNAAVGSSFSAVPGGNGKKMREDSLRSQDARTELEQLALSLEFEYRKARNFIKQKFVRVAEDLAEKRCKKQQSAYSSSYGKRPIERECFFHYTIATDTENIRTVFDDVQVMIILNNINQTILN